MTELPTSAPLALNRAVFERHYEKLGDKVSPDGVIGAAADAAAHGHLLATQVIERWRVIMADETKPYAGRLVSAKAATSRTCEAIARRVDQAIDTVTNEIARLDKEMNPAVPTDSAVFAMESEMRNLLRSSTFEKRGEIFAQAAKNGDPAPYRAAFAGHPSLSGMTAEEMSGRKAQYQRGAHPQSYARRERLQATLHDLKIASDSVVSFAEKLFRPQRSLRKQQQQPAKPPKIRRPHDRHLARRN